jgi:hypothetical protein
MWTVGARQAETMGFRLKKQKLAGFLSLGTMESTLFSPQHAAWHGYFKQQSPNADFTPTSSGQIRFLLTLAF